MRIVVSDPKTGKSYQKELEKEKETMLSGKKIGEEIAGDELGLGGYTLELTGGSDKSGFPMRKDVSGIRKTTALLSGGVGFHPKDKGARKRKTIRGNTISGDIQQVNLKVKQPGSQTLEQLFPASAKPEEKK